MRAASICGNEQTGRIDFVEKLYFGILSTSSIAPRFIAAVRAAGAGEVVAISSRSLEKAREKAKLWQIPTAYGDHNELLADERINIVIATGPNRYASATKYFFIKALYIPKHTNTNCAIVYITNKAT